MINWSYRFYPRNQIPDDHLKRYLNSQEGENLRSLLTDNDKSFVMFYDNDQWKDFFFEDKGICEEHINFL